MVDKLTYAGNIASLREVWNHPRFKFFKASIDDKTQIVYILKKFRPTYVANFAAETHVDRSIDSPESFIKTNVVGTFQLLESCRLYFRALKGPAKREFRFLHVSTDEVFGSLGKTGKFTENTPYDPRSPYSASKAAADHLVRAYSETFQLPVLITNCSNNFGPFQFPEKLIPLMILNAIEGRRLPIYGDGQNVRDWLYVEDHCEGIWRVLKKGKAGEKYNIGGHGEKKNIQVVDMICRFLEEIWPAAENDRLKKLKTASYRHLKTFVTDRPGHDRRYAIDASKIRNQLHWRPKWGFEEGLRKTIAWYLSNLEWCRKVQTGKYSRERLGLAK